MNKATNIANLQDKMEEAVRARDSAQVRDLAGRLLGAHRRSIPSRIAVADAFRRMGWFRDGYRVVQPDRWSVQPILTSTPRGAQQLTCARLVNLLGGTSLALSMLERIRPESALDHRIFANIHVSAYQYEPALHHFTRSIDLETDLELYEFKLAHLGQADCLAYLGRVDEALKVVDRIKADPRRETLLLGIRDQARGEYLALAGRWKESRDSLLQALPRFPGTDSPDHGFLYKWLGYTQAQLGHKAEARKYFMRALKILKKPASRAETWLDTFRLMEIVGLLDKRERCYLRVYPGLAQNFIDVVPELPQQRDTGATEWWISEARDEWRHGKKRFYGLSREIRLLSLLKRAGPHGIGMTRLGSILWPDEVGSFPFLDQRLHLLMNRLKRVYGFDPRVANREVRLTAEDLSRIDIEFSSRTLPLRFFEMAPEFSSREFGHAYSVGKTQAAIRLQSAIKSGEIEQIPGTSGPTTRYRARLARA